jgi:hypothetical protein
MGHAPAVRILREIQDMKEERQYHLQIVRIYPEAYRNWSREEEPFHVDIEVLKPAKNKKVDSLEGLTVSELWTLKEMDLKYYWRRNDFPIQPNVRNQHSFFKGKWSW